jgi:hypothetical protein
MRHFAKRCADLHEAQADSLGEDHESYAHHRAVAHEFRQLHKRLSGDAGGLEGVDLGHGDVPVGDLHGPAKSSKAAHVHVSDEQLARDLGVKL